MEAMKKFVVIGPESTGKSTLCSQLAQHFNTKWVPEYAREYLEKNGTNYTYDDLLIIARGQIDLEESLSSQLTIPNSRLFIDTDMYVMKVWCEYVFNKYHNWVLNRIAERKYDGYLLCNVDLPWVKDNLREYPDLETRNKLYNFYRDILINQNTPWVEINGSYRERFESALKFVT
jgi:NadR type nicotinamide-nucleotide adenylyltransferase